MTQAIFLSYASQDADAARRICDALRAAGLEVWFDQSELRGGDAWDQSIRKQIKECALFVPMISSNTQAREEGFFRLEWKLAVDRSHLMADNKAFFVPVLLGDVSEPAALVPDKFRERQWSRLNDENAIAAFAGRVAKLLAGSGSPVINGPKIAPVLGLAVPIPTAKADDTPSIAVLPFINMSRDEENEYFADGLAEELLNVIARIRGLRVAARTSSFSFKGKDADIPTIAARLNVATVLEGSVRKVGRRIRVTAQLISAADGYHLWSETYDRELDDIFAVQDDIAQSVVTKLRATLMGEKVAAAGNVVAEVAGAAKGRSENVEAQRLYMQGRHLLNRKSAEDLMRSITYFQEAVALDPGFGLAWASLAQAHHDTGGWGLKPVQEANARALAAMEKALALAPDLVDVHLSHAAIQLSFQFNWEGAGTSLKRALELDPDDADALTAASRLQFFLGNFGESIALGRRAVERDPLNAFSHRSLAMTLYATGDLQDAVRLLRMAIEISPDAIATRHLLAIVLGLQGRHEEALAEASLERAEWARLTATSVIKWLMKEPLESNRLLAELEEKYGQDSGVQVAYLHAMRGSADQCFAWLERAFVQRDAGLVLIKSMRFFEPVRDDPRWALFLKKMGFPG